MDGRNLIDQSVSTDYCKLFGAPNCTQCLLTLIVTQFVEISFKCYQESGELVLGQPIQRELDDPSISSFLDSLNQFSSGLDVSDGLFASPVNPSSTYIYQGGDQPPSPLGYNNDTAYTNGYLGNSNLTGSVVIPTIGDVQVPAPSAGSDLFNALMVGQMQSLIIPDPSSPPGFPSPPPPPPQPPPALSITQNGLARDDIQNPDTLILDDPVVTLLPPPPSDAFDTSQLLQFLQNRGEADPQLDLNGLFDESVPVPTITIAPKEESNDALVTENGDGGEVTQVQQNGDPTSQVGDRFSTQTPPVFDVPILAQPQVEEFNNSSLVTQNGALDPIDNNQVPSRDIPNSQPLQDLSQLISWQVIPVVQIESPVPEIEEVDMEEEDKFFNFPVLMSSFFVPMEELQEDDSFFQIDQGNNQQKESDIPPSMEDINNYSINRSSNNSNNNNLYIDCDYLDGVEEAYQCAFPTSERISSQNISYLSPTSEFMDDLSDIIQLPTLQNQSRTFSPQQEKAEQSELDETSAYPNAENLLKEFIDSKNFLPAPEFELDTDSESDPRLLQQLLNQQQQNQQQSLYLQTREPEIEIDYLQDIDKSVIDDSQKVFVPVPVPESEFEFQNQNFDYSDLILQGSNDFQYFLENQSPENEDFESLDYIDNITPEIEINFEQIDQNNEIIAPGLEPIAKKDPIDQNNFPIKRDNLNSNYQDGFFNLSIQEPEPELEANFELLDNFDHQDHNLKIQEFSPEPEIEFELQIENFNDFPILTTSLDPDFIIQEISPEPEMEEFEFQNLSNWDAEKEFEYLIPEPEFEFEIDSKNSILQQQFDQNFELQPTPEFETAEIFESEYDYDPELTTETVLSKQPYYIDIISKGFVANETFENEIQIQILEPEIEPDSEFFENSNLQNYDYNYDYNFQSFPILQSVNPFLNLNFAPEPEIEQISIDGDRGFSAIDDKFEERSPGRDVPLKDENTKKQFLVPQSEPLLESQDVLFEGAPLDFDLLATVKGTPEEPQLLPSPSPSPSSGGFNSGFYTIWIPFLGAAVLIILVMVVILFVMKARAAAAAGPLVAAPAGEAASAGRQAVLLARAEVYGYNPPV